MGFVCPFCVEMTFNDKLCLNCQFYPSCPRNKIKVAWDKNECIDFVSSFPVEKQEEPEQFSIDIIKKGEQ